MTPEEIAAENRELVAIGTHQDALPDYLPRLRVIPTFARDVLPLLEHFQALYDQYERRCRENAALEMDP